MGFPLGETVVVRRKTGATQDADGNDIPTFVPTTYTGVSVGPGTTLELTDNQDLVSSEIHAIFQPAIALTATDEIDVQTGLYIGTWKAGGRPKQYRSPHTGTSVTDAAITEATG